MLCFAIFRFPGDVLIINDRGGLTVFVEHGGVFDRCLGFILPVLFLGLAFDLLLSDCGNIFPEQP